jgi:hypothetical protein
MEYKINLLWDNEASVWVATSEDIPGLVMESGSFDALLERVRVAAPELIALNGNQNKQFLLKADLTAKAVMSAEL